MRRRWLADAILVGGAAVVIAIEPPESRLDLLRAAIFLAGLVAAVRIIRRVAPREARSPDLFDVELHVPARPEIGAIRSIALELQMAVVHPFGAAWVTSLLRELAAGRLLSNRGIDIDREPEAARRVLGEPLWHLVGPTVGRWPAGNARMSAAEIETCVTALERV